MLFLFTLGAFLARLPHIKASLQCFLCSSSSQLFHLLSEHLIVLAFASHIYVLSCYGVWGKAWAAINLDHHYLAPSILSIIIADLFCLAFEIYELHNHEVRKWQKKK